MPRQYDFDAAVVDLLTLSFTARCVVVSLCVLCSHSDEQEQRAHVRLPSLCARVGPGAVGVAGRSHGGHLRAVRDTCSGTTPRLTLHPSRGMHIISQTPNMRM